MKLDQAANTWLRSVRSRSERTAANYVGSLNILFGAIGLRPRKLTSFEVGRFLEVMENLSPGSRATHISAIRSFFRWLEAEGVIPQCPIHALVRPRVERVQVNYLDEAEAVRLLKVAKPEEIVPLALMAVLGLRVSECLVAEWRHLYVEGGKVGLLIPRGKGGKTRSLPIPSALLALLEADRRRRGLGATLDGRDQTPIVAKADGGGYTRQGMFKLVRRAAERALIRKKVGPHTLRHTAATCAVRNGVSVTDLQQTLGHSRLDTTQFYIHLVRGLANPTADTVAAKLLPAT